MMMHLWHVGRDSAERNPERNTRNLLEALFTSGKYVALGVLFLLFLLLGQAMVHHRFTDGGWVNRNGTVRP